jgi:predicted RNA binding protein YcfA (HicA-like mRNA interferase family)
MLNKFKKAGWSGLRQKGSHVRVQKGEHYETIPMHDELKKGLESYLLKRLKEVG